jgi:hypothetical protein
MDEVFRPHSLEHQRLLPRGLREWRPAGRPAPKNLDRLDVVDFALVTCRTCPRKLDRFEVEDVAAHDPV